MSQITTTAFLTILAVAPGTAIAGTTAEDAGGGTREFELGNVQFPEAATVLRTIVGTRQIEQIGDHGLRVTGTPETLEVAERVVQMIDLPTADSNGLESFHVPSGGDVVAGIGLRNVSAPDAMEVLRILRVSRIATCCYGASMILRDTPEQIEAARKLIEAMEGMCPASE